MPRGGYRPNSGAKKSPHGPFKRIWVPEKWIERVKQLIEELKGDGK